MKRLEKRLGSKELDEEAQVRFYEAVQESNESMARSL